MHDAHVQHSISACTNKKRRVTTTIDGNMAACSLQKEVKSNPKKVCGPQEGHCEKGCEIQGGGQEMAVMIG